ncbi:2-C-methyl-D-erythritol 2,4-cyclodiphosphate synthase [bacterium BMS3Bbin12]|nr:2-C-methyl-D-erythritol 2,4-cyclodiphosphate synthase [bacterium BMS3Abin12]GBE47413.1 2-C-methyl-D-erythritol 2,4-cyclodiphosphate synthase [bacterium BMS3Bbin12]GBE50870.1 2-C-methyl-D-erythritol 2,4-cyclodiphosphate synthase [bacterium BMS3Bbin13]
MLGWRSIDFLAGIHTDMRIGHGYDAHVFQAGRELVLGGVSIPFDRGLAAHSDGDVVIHALCDALLGAAGLGDLGRHFPDSDARYRGIESRRLLRHVVKLLAEGALRVHNVDVTVVAQEPRLAPYRDDMSANLAQDLGVDAGCVNLKATTTEGMGFTGRSEGIAAYAVALLEEAPATP